MSKDWIDFANIELPSSPNKALACSAEICGKTPADMPMASFAVTADAVAASLKMMEPSAEFHELGNGDIRARYVATTPLMRFKDDIDVLIRPHGENMSVMAAYSRSRVGYSDLGANKKRIKKLFDQLHGELDR